MKLRVEETGDKSPETGSDGSGGKMILIIANCKRQRMESPMVLRQKKLCQYLFGKKEYGHRKAPYRAASWAPNDTELQPIVRTSDTQAAAFDLFARRVKKPPPFMDAAITVTGPAASAFIRRTSRALSGVMRSRE